MLSLLIIIIFLYAFYAGARRGWLLETFYAVGFFFSFLFASLLYSRLGPHLELLVPYPSASQNSNFTFFNHHVGLSLSHAFYAGVAFLIILAIGWMITRFLGMFVYQWTFVPEANDVNWLTGGVIATLVTYVGLFLILYLLAMIPIDGLQNALKHSFVAKMMIRYSPFLTHHITQLWVGNIL